MQGRTVIVVAGGGWAADPLPGQLPIGATVIAADGGVDTALALGLHVDLAIGDFDSATSVGLAAAKTAGARIERHPPGKDATDLELALDAAIALDPVRIVVVGSSGGRLDHLLGSVLLLGHERYASAEIDAYLEAARMHIVHRSRVIGGTPGELISLVPLHGAVRGVSTEGLEYPLLGETLPAGTSRGVSNVFAAMEVRITIEHGCLLTICPGPESEETL